MTKKEREEKVQQTLDFINKVCINLQSEDNYKDFLNSSSYMTKYEFEDQLMIYSQRPDATACANFDTWKNTFGKVVKKGTKGIPIIKYDSAGNKNIQYVFDITDTINLTDSDVNNNELKEKILRLKEVENKITLSEKTNKTIECEKDEVTK